MISICKELAPTTEVSQNELCLMKTKDVLHALDFDLPVAVFQKFPPHICSTKNLQTLQALKEKRIRQMLCHVPKLSNVAFDLLSVCSREVAPWIGYGLLAHACSKQRTINPHSVKQMLLAIAVAAHRVAIAPFKIESWDSLVRLDERLTKKVAVQAALDLKFPPCPLVFPAKDDLCSLRHVGTSKGLYTLSREFKNCAFDYAWAIASGRALIYSGETPDGTRIILKLYRGRGSWHPGDIRGTGNAEVAIELRKAIYRWVAEEQGLRVDLFENRV
jgi:hypothetical protein